MNDLLDAGARVRDVQLGAGSAADLRTAAEQQEAALRAVMRKAEKAAAARGSSTPATLEKVRETLRAGALDADLAEQVRRGVLVREQRAVGFPLGVSVPAERRRPAVAKRVQKERRPAAKPKPRDEVAAKRVQRATAAAEAARDDLASAEDDLSRAREAFEALTAEVESAHRAVTAAERQAADARRAVERAEKAHARASQTAARAAAQLQELTAP